MAEEFTCFRFHLFGFFCLLSIDNKTFEGIFEHALLLLGEVG